MVKVGLIGLGFMGRAHLQNYQKHSEVKLTAVSDSIAKRLKGDFSVEGNIPTKKDIFDFAGIRTYEKADELIVDEGVDLVDICLPTHLHAEFTIKALNNGKDVLCEKPMAGNLEECNSMIAAAEKTGRKLMIGQCLRFWPEYEVLKDYVETGKMGKLVALFCFRGGGTPAVLRYAYRRPGLFPGKLDNCWRGVHCYCPRGDGKNSFHHQCSTKC